MKTVRVEVTAELIAAGIRKSCFECPLALAAMRALGGEFAYITTKGCCVDFPEGSAPERVRFRLPELAVDFMRAFDGGHNVEPFSFEIEIPS